MRVKDIDDIAGVGVPGGAFDRAGEDPGVAVAQGALAVGAQVEGWVGHFFARSGRLGECWRGPLSGENTQDRTTRHIPFVEFSELSI